MFYGNNLTRNSAGKAIVGTPNLPSRDMAPWLLLEWARASVLLHNDVLAQGGRFFHFLQPNQYVIGSKPLAQREETDFVNKSSFLYDNVNPSYQMLREGGEILRKRGIDFVDASQVFASTQDELYINDCCHFSKKGNDIFFDFVRNVLMEKFAQESSFIDKYISIPSVNKALMRADSVKHRYFAKYNDFGFDLFTPTRLIAITNLLPQETPARHERWAVTQRHTIAFYLPDAIDLQLSGDFLNLEDKQILTISLNGQELKRITDVIKTNDPFDTVNLNHFDMTIPAKRGYNTIVGTCTKYNTKDRNFAILYRHLELKSPAVSNAASLRQ